MPQKNHGEDIDGNPDVMILDVCRLACQNNKDKHEY